MLSIRGRRVTARSTVVVVDGWLVEEDGKERERMDTYRGFGREKCYVISVPGYKQFKMDGTEEEGRKGQYIVQKYRRGWILRRQDRTSLSFKRTSKGS